MNNELYHYGVIGMKWGVRRYQNPDGTLTAAGKKRYESSKSTYTLPKGTEMYRMSASPIPEGRGRKYASFLEDDRETYNARGGMALGSDYEHTLKAKQDLKVAKGKTVLKEYMKYTGDTRIKDLNVLKDDYDTWAYIDNNGISACFVTNESKGFLDKMKKKYDVIVDLEDLYNFSWQPIIILNDDKVETTSIKRVR